jgi:inositol-polyphosphate multikinase
VQTWAHAQTKFRLYASSLLFVYDARRLRHHKTYHTKTGSPPNGKLNGHTNGTTPSGDPKEDLIEPTRHYYQIQRCHSTTNNYDQDYKEMRQQYELMLDSLVLESVHKKEWATIKMIDFAHAFETAADERGTRDENYVFGVDNLVAMFEEFLKECEQH